MTTYTINIDATYETYDADPFYQVSGDFRVTNEDANYNVARELAEHFHGDGIMVDAEMSRFYAYSDTKEHLEALISYLITFVSDQGMVLAVDRAY